MRRLLAGALCSALCAGAWLWLAPSPPAGAHGALAPVLTTTATGAAGPTDVYFDQNEETDFWSTTMAPYAGLATRQLVAPWDTNGQLCLFPDGSGRFTIAYNPTDTSQTTTDGTGQNPGALLAHKQPPVGVAIYNHDGSYSPGGSTNSDGSLTAQDLHVPGPYLLTTSSSQWTSAGVTGPGVVGGAGGLGGDVPPDSNNGPYNDNGTYTGCAFDANGDFFAVDLGTAQGSYPPPSDGRLIEWFKDSGYQGACIVYGPDSGGNQWAQADGEGFSTHHVDGTGGLEQPGIMAADAQGNLYVPVDDADPNTLAPKGKVLEFSNLPTTESKCPTPPAHPASATNWAAANGDQTSYHVVAPTVFIDAAAAGLPFPAAIARDPVCGCWAVDNVFFGPSAVEWFDTAGNPLGQQSHVPIPADFAVPSSPSAPGTSPVVPAGDLSPFGMAFDANGDLFLVDIHVGVDPVGTLSSQSLQAGPIDQQGRLLEFTFTGPIANPPVVIASGEDFPVSVTTCAPGASVTCPSPPATG